jgi:hypothetical protein
MLQSETRGVSTTGSAGTRGRNYSAPPRSAATDVSQRSAAARSGKPSAELVDLEHGENVIGRILEPRDRSRARIAPEDPALVGLQIR